jgi:cation:H+ antiporter
VTLLAARLFARRLDTLGVRFGFPEALVGLLTALAADGPEISSALFALAKGEHSVSVGVLVGSNVFNLAAIGVSVLLAGRVTLARSTLALEGFIGAAITLIGGAVLLGWLSPQLAVLLTVCVAAPYLLLVLDTRKWLASRVRLLASLAHGRGQHASATLPRMSSRESPTHRLLGMVVLDVTLIVAGSAGMVQAALTLGARWGVSTAILGTLILAPLTSLPNAITAVRLGLARRGTALLAETFNSNSINLAAGVIVPSLFVVGLSAASETARLQLAWLIGMTALCLAALAKRHGMGRPEAACLIALYLGFVALELH